MCRTCENTRTRLPVAFSDTRAESSRHCLRPGRAGRAGRGCKRLRPCACMRARTHARAWVSLRQELIEVRKLRRLRDRVFRQRKLHAPAAPRGCRGCRGGWGSRHATAACTVHAHATRSSKSPLTQAGAGPARGTGPVPCAGRLVAVLCRGRSPLRAVVVQYRI